MAPHEGLVHLKEYDIEDSNVELIGSDIDHKVKHNSAQTEPAWNDGRVGVSAGLLAWRIEDFAVVPCPDASERGRFHEGDSYIVLHSWTIGNNNDKLGHDIFFWLGSRTSQDEAGTAAYKTVELDEFLGGAAAQHRELQRAPSPEFLALFPRGVEVRAGGVASGFRHVEEPVPGAGPEVRTLLRVFKPAAGAAVVVHEVEPVASSLDEGDVFVLDAGDKIWVWQGAKCSPMEKARAAQVVHDMTLAKHVDVEVLAQEDGRSGLVAKLLGGGEESSRQASARDRPARVQNTRPRRLFRLSDASQKLTFDLVREGPSVSPRDLDGNDVFLLDDEGRAIWVWVGLGASKAERAMWLKVAQSYIRRVLESREDSEAYLTPIAKVQQGHETAAFLRAIQAA